MKDTMDDIEERADDEEAAEDEEVAEDAEPTPADLAAAAVPPAEPAAVEVESIQELIVKQEARAEEAEAADDEEEALLATMTREERLDPVDTKVVPMQATEFVCKRCYLVKHRSQLADKKRTLCRDCA